MTSTKKVMYAMFFGIHGVVTQVPIPKGRTVTAKFYKRIVLNKVDKYYRKRRPNTGMIGLFLLQDNATPHKAYIVKKFLESKRVTVLNHPPYSPDLAPCDFFLFPRLKKHLQGRRYSTRNGIGSALHQLCRGIPQEDYKKAFQNWIKRLKLCILFKGDYFQGLKK
ncbi:histone-lysine N-methyltransferase SETMAR-like [Ruditapes philippinarum]|uniref:histone-lysine N-methyltransferase SETMAR-like n=1 Tax=Ruditapes philippinarum TaxID=129788 RepID=UPI00295C0505|nr:histone-lysine N-methyltransferase SETMAR-like [Ruditapes philippinarum]